MLPLTQAQLCPHNELQQISRIPHVQARPVCVGLMPGQPAQSHTDDEQCRQKYIARAYLTCQAQSEKSLLTSFDAQLCLQHARKALNFYKGRVMSTQTRREWSA